MRNLGVYVHIPFCKRKCLYCDFNSYDNKSSLMQQYVQALIGEIGAFCADDFCVDSIYFGGGTPTTLSFEQLQSIMCQLFKTFKVSDSAEISIETNPNTISDYKPLKDMGFNRISIGMQSANDDELKTLGRIHTYAEFAKSYEKAAHYFDNINIDAMLALPGQTIEKWANTLAKIKELSPAHISAYSLKVEENTPFAKMKLNLPDEDSDRRMYYFARDFLNEYSRYEISNFAKEGCECRHNIKYWTRQPYIGFGAGAHSNIGDKRFFNIYDLAEYITAGDKRAETTTLSLNDAMSEFAFLGFRMSKGVSAADFKEYFGYSPEQIFGTQLQKHIKLGTIKHKDDRFFLTDYGIDVSNAVLSDFLL